MGNRLIRIASLSDLHFFHRHVPTAEIIDKINEAFPDNAETAMLDVIILAGDVFERLVTYNDDDTTFVLHWVTRMLRLCAKHDIVLMVLEGTPSHDQKQSRVFETQNEAANIGAKLRYVTEISVEYIESLGITFLCVPDIARDSAETVLAQVKEVMQAKGMQQVDFGITHGMYLYQAVDGCDLTMCHDQHEYLKLVRDTIFSGHIHAHSVYDRLVSHGSFDRLGFGYESPKGHVRLVTDLKGNRELRFVENKRAKIFTTIDIPDADVEATLAIIEARVCQAPNDSHFRLRGPASNPIFSNMDHLIRTYPFLNWHVKPVVNSGKDSEDALFSTDDDEFVYQAIQLTRDNIAPMLMARLAGNMADSSTLEAAERILNEVL